MRKILFTLCLVSTCLVSYGQCSSSCSDNCAPSRNTMAQHSRPAYHRLMAVVGAGPQYTLDQAGSAFPAGKGGDGSLHPATQAQRLNWQAFAFAGIRFDGGYRAPHAFGVFGSYGQLTPEALTEVNALQGLVEDLPLAGSTPDYREVEAGFLLRNWFRISAGIGEQRFVNDAQEAVSQQYYTTTAGFHAPLGQNLRFYANATARYGRDFSEFSIRPTAGIAFQLRALRI